jgi:hypothetical protein
MLKMRLMMLAGVAGLAFGTYAGAEVNVNFDTPSDLANFSQNKNGAALTNMAANPTGGVAGSGGVSTAGTPASVDVTAVYQPSPISVGDGAVHTISTFFTANNGLTNNEKPIQIGFVNGNNKSFNGENFDTGFITARVLGNYTAEVQTKNAVVSGSNQGTKSFSNVASSGITTGDWLKLLLSVQETDATAGNFSYSFSLLDYGPTGTSAVPTVAIAPQTGTVTGLTGISGQDLYAGFRSNLPANYTQTVNYDNFSVDAVVPEPATLGLLGIVGLGLLARRRRA